MKKIVNITLFAFLFLGLFCTTSCDDNKMPRYENDPAIYFDWSVTTARLNYQRDSIKHSFFFDKNLMQDTVWVRVNAMGLTSSVNRSIAIVQTNVGKPNAAVSGKHFAPFDSPGIKEKMIMPANAVNVLIPIVFFRHADLELGEVRLELEVAANEHFRPGIDRQRKFLVASTAQAVKPSRWDTTWRHFFGPTWGTEKFRFIIEVTGFTDWENPPSDMGYIDWMRNMVLQRFAEYNRDNPNDPLKEANGDFVTFN